METTSMFEIGIAEFEEIMKTGRVVGLELVISTESDTGLTEAGWGGGFTIRDP
jgi:hypothetical protein